MFVEDTSTSYTHTLRDDASGKNVYNYFLCFAYCMKQCLCLQARSVDTERTIYLHRFLLFRKK